MVMVNDKEEVMRHQWLGFIVGWMVVGILQAQLDTIGVRLIDSALQFYGLSHRDLWLAWDAVPDDPHRLNIVKRVFERPLDVFTVVRSYRKAAQSAIPQLLVQAQKDLDCAPYHPEPVQYSPDLLDSILEDRIKKHLSYSQKMVLYQLLPFLSDATQTAREVREQWDPDTLQFVLQYLDSLLLPSEESADLNVYELKAAEIRWRQLSKQFFAGAYVRKVQPLLQRSVDWLAYLLSLPLLDSVEHPRYRDIKPIVLETSLGTIAIGGYGNDIYRQPYTMIIDFGGDDRYVFPAMSKTEKFQQPVQCIIDLAGDDVYIGGDYVWGSAVFGVGILLDYQGNDVYIARDFAQGSALFGVGLCIDYSGHDRYVGRSCVQGSAAFGIGLLWDSTGNDVYQCAAQGQAFGFTHGVGVLVDHIGNDQYVTSSPYQDFLRYEQHFLSFTQGAALGYRPIASGGLAFLLDFQGNDHYSSDIYGQGTAYWFGIGALYDSSGEDRYLSYQYAQGAGVHFAHGVLWDQAGDDYYASHGVSQGCGHDIAFGALIDEGGNDNYTVESLSLGGGNADAISLFLDYRGDDTYIARQQWNMLGFSDFRRRYGVLGIFVDGQGQDQYGETVLRNDLQTMKSTFGIFYDAELVPANLPSRSKPQQSLPDSLKEPLANSLDSLFIQASAAPQKYQYNVKPAREKIVAMGRAALPFLATKLGTESARERHALIDILKKLYDRDTAAVVSLILDSLRSANSRVVAMAALIAGEKKIRQAVPLLIPLLSHQRWQRRQLAAYVIGLIGDSALADTLRSYWKNETHPVVQMRLATAIARLKPLWLWQWIVEPLKTSQWVVGPNVVETMRRYGDSLSWTDFSAVAHRLEDHSAALSMWLGVLSKVRLRSADTLAAYQWLRSLSSRHKRQLFARLWQRPNTPWTSLLVRSARQSPEFQVLIQRWHHIRALQR